MAKKALTVESILATFQAQQAEALDLAKQLPSAWVICFDDSTPFRQDAKGFISICGKRIVIANIDGAKNLAAKLDAKAVEAGSSSRVIAMPVTTWATMRAAALDGMITQCNAVLVKA